jgi:hypothetical protein
MASFKTHTHILVRYPEYAATAYEVDNHGSIPFTEPFPLHHHVQIDASGHQIFSMNIAPYFPGGITITNNSVALVSKRTVSIERPPLVGELSANFCG